MAFNMATRTNRDWGTAAKELLAATRSQRLHDW